MPIASRERAGQARLPEAAAVTLPRDRKAAAAGSRPKLIFLVTEDWYFCSHRLPVARAARDAGYEVVVATRVRGHAAAICAEGFRLCPLPWRRRGDGAAGAIRAIAAIAALYRREAPDLVHHVALKPVLFGALALRLAFLRDGSGREQRRRHRPATIAAVTGLGSGLAGGLPARLARPLLGLALRWLVWGGDDCRVIVQNAEDGAALSRIGIDPAQVSLIRGSGVDTAHFAPLPEPGGATVTVALVSRMLRSKGVLDAVAAVRQLRAEGLPVNLVLAGPTDPDNRDSLDDRDLAALTVEPGIVWLGHVADVNDVWRRAAIAVLPSTYGEGLPKTLLEAAACGRPIVATDMPGCRDVVQPGESGLLVPPNDIAALVAALATLVCDPERRAAMGLAGRALVERRFGEERVARETLSLYDTLLRGRRGGDRRSG